MLSSQKERQIIKKKKKSLLDHSYDAKAFSLLTLHHEGSDRDKEKSAGLDHVVGELIPASNCEPRRDAGAIKCLEARAHAREQQLGPPPPLDETGTSVLCGL